MSDNDKEPNGKRTNLEVCIKLPAGLISAGASKKKKQQPLTEVQFQFSREAKVQDILDVLAVTYATRYLTNIDLKFGKRILKDFQILGDIIGNELFLNLQIVLKPYCTRDVLKHVLTLREYLGFSPETIDGLSEFAASTSSKFQQLGLSDIKRNLEQDEDESEDSKLSEKHVLKVSDSEKSDFERTVKEILSGINHSSVTEVNAPESNIITPCLRSLSLSAYNPVPPSYKSEGHLLYLQAGTLEGENFHITASTSGFFINKSTSTSFDPVPKEFANEGKVSSQAKHTLFDLLALRSKKLISHVNDFEKKVRDLNPIAYIKPVNTFLHKPWMVSTSTVHSGDYLRMQLDSLSFETERNFNDEFQAVKDLPADTLQARMDSEKLLAKIISEFTVVATKGAMSIFYGDFVAMNPDATKNEQIFLKDNIFYSFVSDVNGAFESKGGHEAAIAASNQDLRIINLLNRVGTQEIRYLLSTIVEFCGRRILAQTPVPGLLSTMGTKNYRDPETGEDLVEDLPNDISVMYGYDESTRRVISNKAFDDAIQKELAKVFHLKSHEIDGSGITLSSQSKGIMGFDKRKYVLDLANTCPLDINFVRDHYDNVDVEKQYPHRQTLLRPELVEKWWQQKIQKEGLDYNTAYEDNKFSFNPDAYQVEGISDGTVDEISDYLRDVILPGIVEDYSTGNVTAPYDGEHVVENLHINGVNVRYLGTLIELAKKCLDDQIKKYQSHLNDVAEGNKEHEEWEKEYLIKVEKLIKARQEEINKYVQEGKEVPKELTEQIKLPEEELRKPTKEAPFIINKDELLPLIHASEIEIISRSIKHILRKHSKNIPLSLVPALIAFVFNLVFGIGYNSSPSAETGDGLNGYEFCTLTRSSLLESISEQAFLRFRYVLPSNWIEKYTAAPFALIRSICYQFGIQLANKDYFFNREQLEIAKQLQEKKSRFLEPLATFSAEDVTIIPRVKSAEYDSIVSDELWAQGAATIESDQNTALSLLSQSVTIREDISSTLSKSVAEKNLSLSTIYNNVGLLPEAVNFARKACMIYERVCGIDSFEVLRSLSNLAVLELSSENVLNTALVYKRIISTVQSFNLVAVHHPIVISALNSLEQLALGIENPRLAIDILKHLAEIIVSLDSADSLEFGYVQSRIGNIYASMNIMPRALEHISCTKDIFTTQLGMNHELSVQAKQWNEGLNNLMKTKQQQKALQDEQTKSNNTEGKAQRKESKSIDEGPNPELADKSVEELLSFIEGDSQESSKKTKTKKNKNKNKKK
ncbi:hypothetical protein HG535_0G03590 [Zygotorulaspora mrakii]|uniref:Clu domain-containing protein n=1 Tax=Zygotorulaspora mrakii TaxID=42260 RepID=A0A7H9B7Z2_ZYGMR|nr:uncharacterized protein HG535_0G03590 [Zygotorulaspora mrakii]QLG74476.1 hypothetical protein HG535_0G03590 [Zygotorulaspora mrakii]